MELNAHVCKGEKGSLVVYAKSMMRKEENEQGEERDREICHMKGYTVSTSSRSRGCRNTITAGLKSQLTEPSVSIMPSVS